MKHRRLQDSKSLETVKRHPCVFQRSRILPSLPCLTDEHGSCSSGLRQFLLGSFMFLPFRKERLGKDSSDPSGPRNQHRSGHEMGPVRCHNSAIRSSVAHRSCSIQVIQWSPFAPCPVPQLAVEQESVAKSFVAVTQNQLGPRRDG